MEAETTDPVKGEGSAWVLGSHFCLQGEVLMFLAAVRSLLCLAPSVFDRILHLQHSVQFLPWNASPLVVCVEGCFPSRQWCDKHSSTYTVDPHYLQIQQLLVKISDPKSHTRGPFVVICGHVHAQSGEKFVTQCTHCQLRLNEAKLCLLVSTCTVHKYPFPVYLVPHFQPLCVLA